MANNQQKIELIQTSLNLDLEACDLKWTLFVAAAQSYRYDSRLTPFPFKYTSILSEPSAVKERFDIETILRSIQSIPALHSIQWPDLTVEAVDLLFWALVLQTESLTIKTIPKNEVNIF